MWKCGNYIAEQNSDCYYQDDRCCWYCDKRDICDAKSKCLFDCYDDDNDTDNAENVNAYWVE